MRDIFVSGTSNSFTVFLATPLINVSRAKLLSAYSNVTTGPYIFLDIQELRRPIGLLTSNTNTATGNNIPRMTESMSAFAVVQTGNVYFNSSSSYDIIVEYPTPIDKIDRLTVRYLDINSNLVPITNPAFILQFESVAPKVVELPDEEEEKEPPKRPNYLGFLLIGIVMILFFLRRRKS